MQKIQTSLLAIPTNQSIANIGFINLLAETELWFTLQLEYNKTDKSDL